MRIIIIIIITVMNFDANGNSNFIIDTLELPSISIQGGVDLNYNFNDKNARIGKSFDFSTKYNRSILESVIFSSGIIFKHKEYSKLIAQNYPVINSDTAQLSHFYNIQGVIQKISIPFDIRLRLIHKPCIYLVVGLSGEFNIQNKLMPIYMTTIYFDKYHKELERNQLQGIVPKNIQKNFFNLNFRFGLSYRVNRMNIDFLVSRDKWPEETTSLGFRMGYRLFDFTKKIENSEKTEKNTN